MSTEKIIGEGVGFERIRRITGYLVGDLNRFNDAKRAEVRDRVAHTVPPSSSGEAEREPQMPREEENARNIILRELERAFNLPDGKCMTFEQNGTVFPKSREYDNEMLNRRLDVLRYIASNHNKMTNDQIEFWLDTIRYDGDIDLDKEKTPEQLGYTRAEANMREVMERARQAAEKQSEEQKRAERAADERELSPEGR